MLSLFSKALRFDHPAAYLLSEEEEEEADMEIRMKWTAVAIEGKKERKQEGIAMERDLNRNRLKEAKKKRGGGGGNVIFLSLVLYGNTQTWSTDVRWGSLFFAQTFLVYGAQVTTIADRKKVDKEKNVPIFGNPAGRKLQRNVLRYPQDWNCAPFRGKMAIWKTLRSIVQYLFSPVTSR
jgi:hypothetical protein